MANSDRVGVWPRALAARLFFLCLCIVIAATYYASSATVQAATLIINQDTTIDAASPISGSGIQVIDGPGGPASVDIVSGGIVAGFNGRENSTITLDGGAVTYLSSLRDNATLHMTGGQLDCTEPICLVIDYSELLSLDDNSSIHIFGGVFLGPIALHGSSTAHFYGTGLRLTAYPEGGIVEGNLASGEPAYLSVFGSTSHIFLHEIPEPPLALAGTTCLAALVSVHRIRWPRRVLIATPQVAKNDYWT